MDALTVYKSLADETRLQTLLLITHYADLCVCDIQAALQLSQPKISRHLAELRRSDLLQDERRGRWVFYQLHPDLPAWVRQLLHITLENQSDYMAPCLQRLSAVGLTECHLADCNPVGRDSQASAQENAA